MGEKKYQQEKKEINKIFKNYKKKRINKNWTKKYLDKHKLKNPEKLIN
jgi:hypothetical protein